MLNFINWLWDKDLVQTFIEGASLKPGDIQRAVAGDPQAINRLMAVSQAKGAQASKKRGIPADLDDVGQHVAMTIWEKLQAGKINPNIDPRKLEGLMIKIASRYLYNQARDASRFRKAATGIETLRTPGKFRGRSREMEAPDRDDVGKTARKYMNRGGMAGIADSEEMKEVRRAVEQLAKESVRQAYVFWNMLHGASPGEIAEELDRDHPIYDKRGNLIPANKRDKYSRYTMVDSLQRRAKLRVKELVADYRGMSEHQVDMERVMLILANCLT